MSPFQIWLRDDFREDFHEDSKVYLIKSQLMCHPIIQMVTKLFFCHISVLRRDDEGLHQRRPRPLVQRDLALRAALHRPLPRPLPHRTEGRPPATLQHLHVRNQVSETQYRHRLSPLVVDQLTYGMFHHAVPGF